jgi:hypothetical protein
VAGPTIEAWEEKAHTCGARSRATPAPANVLAELANDMAGGAALGTR